MPNILSGPISASAPTNVLVGVASGAAVAANNNRVGLVLVNISNSTVYLGLQGAVAVLNSGIVLTPNGGSFSMDEYSYNTDAVTAIAHVAGSTLTIQELIR